MTDYYIVPESSLTATADAIREKTGSQADIEFDQNGFADAIEGISENVWKRPFDWPDISAMDYTDEVVYMTYCANESNGFCAFSFRTSTGDYSVEIGQIVNGVFTADNTYTVASNTNCAHYFGSSSGGYKVIRVKALTGNIVGYSFYKNSYFTDGGMTFHGLAQGLLEFYANLGTLTKNDGFFRNAYFLESIHMGNVKLPTSISYMLSGCRRLEQIDAASWDTSIVQDMSGLFQTCGLKYADISDWDTSALTSISDMFYQSRFVELDLNKWDISRCTSFHYLFENSHNLKTLNISDWNVSNVTNFLEVFYNCAMLTSIDVSKWDTSSAINMQSVFYGCVVLQDIDISGWDFTNVTNTTNIFRSNQSIASISFPSTLTTIGNYALNNTTNCFEFHFTSQSPPTLSDTNAFPNMGDGNGRKIYVPYSADHSILEAYQTATNWSTYASYIFEEPQGGAS